MTLKSDNLLLERLRIMRHEGNTRFDQLSSKIDTLSAEVRISNASAAGQIQSNVLTNQRLTELENRLQRIECALDLSQTPPSS